MQKYEIGQTVPSFIGHSECVQFDINDSGAMMVVFFNRPTQEEINQFAAGKNFEIRFTQISGVIMITTKIGNLNWMDAPYNPHLSKNLTTFELPDNNKGLGLTLVLVDSSTGQIKHLRLIGLSEQFTKRLFGAALEQKMQDFDAVAYQSAIARIYAAYPTAQIVKMSGDYCKVNS